MKIEEPNTPYEATVKMADDTDGTDGTDGTDDIVESTVSLMDIFDTDEVKAAKLEAKQRGQQWAALVGTGKRKDSSPQAGVQAVGRSQRSPVDQQVCSLAVWHTVITVSRAVQHFVVLLLALLNAHS
jgi:hypothetical protein